MSGSGRAGRLIGSPTDLVIALVAATELVNESVQQQFTNLWKFCINDGDERSENGRERKGRSLCPHD